MQKSATQVQIKNTTPAITNGLADAIVGNSPLSNQLSQTDTVFRNLRNYFISNMRQVLSQAYVEIGIVKTIVDVPVDDALRGGVEIKSKLLSPEEIEELQYSMDQSDDLAIIGESLKWDRLFGGAGILIETGQDWETPFEISSIKEKDPLSFKAVDMWELFWDYQNIEGDGQPLDDHNVEFFRYYGKKIHKSRVMVTKGLKAPSMIRPRLRGWGISVVEVLIRSINQFLKATDLTFEVLDQFKIDIYKIKNLTNTLMSPDGADKIRRRIQLANQQKNFQNAIAMDGEDDYIQKELSFSGISETMSGIRMQIASDLRMPLTKVFGISTAGFSSGEDDIENYNSMIESTVRMKSKHHILKMIKIRCQQLFGSAPEDLQISFKPLRVLSSEQEENVKTQKFARLLQARTSGLISAKEFKDACNKDQLLSIQVDTSEEELNTGDEKSSDKEALKPTAPAKMSKLSAPEAIQ